MVVNNGLAERQNKIKLTSDSSAQIINQYEEAPIFSVEATGENISYQWQYKDPKLPRWYDVPNGILPDLKLSNIPLGLNNTQFRCKVYNNVGAVYSDISILKVKQPLTIPTISVQPTPEVEVSPTTDADIYDDIYAQVVIGINSGGGGGGGSSDIYVTTNINNTDVNAVPSAATVKSHVANSISASQAARKFIYINDTDLEPVNGIITLPIQHNLNDLYVFTNLIQRKDNALNPFLCSITYNDVNSITLDITYGETIPANDLMVIVSK